MKIIKLRLIVGSNIKVGEICDEELGVVVSIRNPRALNASNSDFYIIECVGGVIDVPIHSVLYAVCK